MRAARPPDHPRAGQHRQRIIAAAGRLTVRSGWASVTMAQLADEVGVSRQTVYNEIGSRQVLAEAMVLAECARFLDLVDVAFAAHPDDVLSSIRDATRAVLEMSAQDALLRAVVSATHGADTELLPLLTTHAQPLLDTVKVLVGERLEPFALPLEERQTATAVDIFVRAVLSHVMQPGGDPEIIADDITRLVGRILRP